MTPVVELKEVRKVYRSGTRSHPISVEALKGVGLVIEPGEYVAIMGPSGSGKSTLLQILGLLDTPTSGSYKLSGLEVAGISEIERAKVRNRKIGFVFQAFFLLPHMSLLENVALPLVYRGVGLAKRNHRAQEALARVGLGDRIDHLPSEISGGQKQRAAIARALVQEPDILLADEPTGNLDSVATDEILAIMDSLHSEGKTLVVVTHENEVGARAERIIRVRDGRIEA